MSKMSRWMLAYGLLLIVCNVLDSFSILPIHLRSPTLITGWTGGVLMIAAAICCTQGRRSLRVTGMYVGLFLPLILAGIFAWRASVRWRFQTPDASLLPAMVLSFLSLLSLIELLILTKLRPRDGIASRGYSVTFPSIKRKSVEVNEKSRRSEAG
ncbi:MAG TPA: hypothetical protein VKK61_07970 [Tepidisphaeraceae bacterium]|jgi:hypothetical protein|nr:hypothetical protein [Tepidisphaeraceae bacterium]